MPHADFPFLIANCTGGQLQQTQIIGNRRSLLPTRSLNASCVIALFVNQTLVRNRNLIAFKSSC